MEERIDRRTIGQTDVEILSTGRIPFGDLAIPRRLSSGHLSERDTVIVISKVKEVIEALEGGVSSVTPLSFTRALALYEGVLLGMLIQIGEIDSMVLTEVGAAGQEGDR